MIWPTMSGRARTAAPRGNDPDAHRRLGTWRVVAGLKADTARGLHLQRVEQVNADRRNSHAVGIAAICKGRWPRCVSHSPCRLRAFSVLALEVRCGDLPSLGRLQITTSLSAPQVRAVVSAVWPERG